MSYLFHNVQGEEDYLTSPVKNLCQVCGVDMGYGNPRQYCGKTYCPKQAVQQPSFDYSQEKVLLVEEKNSILLKKIEKCLADLQDLYQFASNK
jgi:methionyl-tRNA synthetase